MPVPFKKKQIKGGHYLYSFKDVRNASIEESDQDLDPKTTYLCYDDRWLLELVFIRYKNDEYLDQTNVQSDFSVLGNEFVNYISTVATCRIIHKARQCGLLEKTSYGDLMDDLSSAWRRKDAPPEPKPEPKKRERKPKDPDTVKIKRSRGRPRKDANQSVGSL